MDNELDRKKACWIGFWGNVGLAVFKIIIGLFGYSRLIFIDGLHSGANATILAAMLIGLHISEKPADADHNYGHDKVQFILSGLSGLIITCAAVILLTISLISMRLGYTAQVHTVGILTAVISIIGNIALYRYLTYSGEKLGSPMLIKNARNNLINAFCSFLILIAISGVLFQLYLVEQMCAVMLAIILICWGINIFRIAVERSMDRIQSPRQINEIRQLAISVEEVKKVPDVKIIQNGDRDLVDLEIQVDGKTQADKAYTIAEQVKKMVFQKLKYVKNVVVKVSPVIIITFLFSMSFNTGCTKRRAGAENEQSRSQAVYRTSVLRTVNIQSGYSYITPEQVKAKIDAGEVFVLIDMRPRSFYDAGHIAGAVSLPIKELGRKYQQLDPKKEIVVYCQTGVDSEAACRMLVQFGFTDVKSMVGGVSQWQYGLTIEDSGMII